MDRRTFLRKSALGGGAAAATALAAPAIAQDKVKLTMVTSWGRGLAGVFDAAQKVADNVNAMSDGSIEIEVKAAGELVGAFEVFDAVSSGQADMYHAADYYFISQHPAFAFFTGVPFGMTATEQNKLVLPWRRQATSPRTRRDFQPQVVPRRKYRHPGRGLVPAGNRRSGRFQRSEVPHAGAGRQGTWLHGRIGPEPARRRSVPGFGIRCDRRNRVDWSLGGRKGRIPGDHEILLHRRIPTNRPQVLRSP